MTEYKISSPLPGTTIGALEAMMNENARNGWVLHTLVHNGNHYVVVYAKEAADADF